MQKEKANRDYWAQRTNMVKDLTQRLPQAHGSKFQQREYIEQKVIVFDEREATEIQSKYDQDVEDQIRNQKRRLQQRQKQKNRNLKNPSANPTSRNGTARPGGRNPNGYQDKIRKSASKNHPNRSDSGDDQPEYMDAQSNLMNSQIGRGQNGGVQFG